MAGRVEDLVYDLDPWYPYEEECLSFGGEPDEPLDAPASLEAVMSFIAVARKPGGVIGCGISLRLLGLTELPDLSQYTIDGSFDCSRNNLTSLRGCPKAVTGSFYCSYNWLINLQYAPKVGDCVYASNNLLLSLAGCPKTHRLHLGDTPLFRRHHVHLAVTGRLPWATLGGLKTPDLPTAYQLKKMAEARSQHNAKTTGPTRGQ
jgi:hypothetical protein